LLWLEQKPSKVLPPLLSDLRARGYELGRNLQVLDFTVTRYEALPEAARKLVGQKPDMIVTFGSTSAQAAHNATLTIHASLGNEFQCPEIDLDRRVCSAGDPSGEVGD